MYCTVLCFAVLHYSLVLCCAVLFSVLCHAVPCRACAVNILHTSQRAYMQKNKNKNHLYLMPAKPKDLDRVCRIINRGYFSRR